MQPLTAIALLMGVSRYLLPQVSQYFQALSAEETKKLVSAP
jgi:hypothetical protein